MGRFRALPLLIGALSGALLVSGASGADPRTPAALPGLPPPFLGTAVLGDGGLLAAVDSYGDVIDLRYPGPAGSAQIANPYLRQVAGTVPSDTGIVVAAAAGRRAPRPLWRAGRLRQRYLAGTNVVRTEARVGGAAVSMTSAVAGERLARTMDVRGRPGQRLVLRLGIDLHPTTRVRCEAVRETAAPPQPRVGPGTVWRGRGSLSVDLTCGFGVRPRPAAVVIGAAAPADRRWLARRRPLARTAPGWAKLAYARSLLVLRALTGANGAVAAGARDHWAYVWPRDAGTAAMALAAAGYPDRARRVAGFLSRLDLDAGARFRGDGLPVEDGRALPGDAAGWVTAARRAAGLSTLHAPVDDWADRGDYGERDDDRGDYLGNAIAGGAPASEIKRLFGSPAGLERRAADPGSGIDSAAAWAVRPFPRPALYPLVRRTLTSLLAGAGRFGLRPSQDWPRDQAWTAPAGWSAWSLAALGERSAALRMLAILRRDATELGTIPERVDPRSGLPPSTTPLGWTHSFLILALRQLYGR